MCTRTSCPGQFKCHNTSICISAESICDDILDCNLADDEHFCYPLLPNCPENSRCVIFSIYCFNSTYTEYETYDPFVHVVLVHSEFDAFPKFLEMFERIIFLSLWNTGIYKMCSLLSALSGEKTIMYLDVANNNIEILISVCFQDMNRLMFLNASLNMIKTIQQFTFSKVTNIMFIDLSNNYMEYLGKNVFKGINNLRMLKLKHNNFVYVSTHSFYESSVHIIVTDNYKICCVKPNKRTDCSVFPIWPYSCDYKLLPNVVSVVISWIISMTGLLLNVIAMLFNVLEMKKAERDVGYNYGISVIGIVITDILACLGLFIILLADSSMGNNYFELEYSWRGSLYCYISSFLSLSYLLLSGFIVNFIAISRYSLVKFPLDSPFINSLFVKICIGMSIFIVWSGSLAIMLQESARNKLLSTGLCLLIGSTNTLFAKYLTAILLTGYSVALPLLYTFLHLERRKSGKVLEKSGLLKASKSHDIAIPLLNLLCLIPSDIILILTIIWDEYPLQMLVWANALVFPLNIIIDPFLFVLSKKIKNK